VPTIDDDALVLDHHPYRDRHLILAVLTRNTGVQRGVLRRARGSKVPSAAATQVLSRVHVTLYQRPHAELADFRHVELVTSSFPIARDLGTSAAGAVVAELLATFCPLGEPSERSFRLGVAALEALLSRMSAQSVVAYVQFWTLALGGVLADPAAIIDAIGSDGADFLATCRRSRLAEVDGPVPSAAACWLDQRVREEAERPLRALSFFRSMTGS
jgi:DNA repair protein RecO